MKIKHIRSLDIWLLSKGNKVLCRSKQNPWHPPKVLEVAIRREALKLAS